MHLPSGINVVEETAGYVAASTDGTTLTTSATANTMGSWVELSAATVRTWEFFRLTAMSATTTSRFRIDIGIGSAGNEFVLVEQIDHVSEISAQGNETRHYLPVHVPAGSRIAARASQGNANAQTVKVFLNGYSRGPTGAPGFSKVDRVNAGTTYGVTVNPSAANTKTAWVQLTASTAREYHALQVAIGGNADIARAVSQHFLFDIGVGGAGSEQVIMSNMYAMAPGATFETPVNAGFPCLPVTIPAGSRLSVRGQTQVTTAGDRAFDVSAFGFA